MLHWTVNLEGGPRRVNHAAIAAGHKIFSFGGYCTGEDYEHTRPIDIHILNTVSLRWRVVPVDRTANVPYMRYGHTAVNHNDFAYIWGGRNDLDGACSTLFCFNTDTYKWSCPEVQGEKPMARDGHSACVLNSKMYIYGGYEESTDRFSDEIFFLDFRNFNWTQVRAKGTPAKWRDFHTATALKNKMFVFGGRSDEGGQIFTNREIYCHRMHVYDTQQNSWHVVPHVPGSHRPIGRRSHSTFEYNGLLFVFGGYNGLLDEHYSDLHRYDPETGRWTTLRPRGKGPCARRRQCCCVVGSRVYLFGGTSPSPASQAPSIGAWRLNRNSSSLVDHADLHVLDLNPSLKTLCMLKVMEHNLDVRSLPHDLKWDLDMMTKPNTISRAVSNG